MLSCLVLLQLTLSTAWVSTRPWLLARHAGASLQWRLASTQTDAETPTAANDTAASASNVLPTRGSIVTVLAKLWPDDPDFVEAPLVDGVVHSANDSPVELTFSLGMGNYLPGLHDVVSQMQIGDEITTLIDAGWGDYHPDWVYKLPLSSVDKAQSDLLKIGTQLQLSNGLVCHVTEIDGEQFTIDCNHPMAGTSYQANIKLVAVEEGPSDIAVFGNTQKSTSRYETAVFALGCFWGAELLFMRVPGVVGTAVGYTKGGDKSISSSVQQDKVAITMQDVVPPTYEQVCTGTTGYTEAVAVTYDSTKVSFSRLVQIAMDRLGENKYLKNQVGNDKGTQYRHGVYYANPDQAKVAREILQGFGDDCVTECLPTTRFYYAEDYHQQYLLKGGQSARKNDPAVIRCYG
jgi:peptide-methionine (S)-S-oxide reductase